MEKLRILNRRESSYLQTHNPYYDSRAKYGREGDTIFLVVFKTPTGRWSKKMFNIRINADYPKTSTEKINLFEKMYKDVIRDYKNDIKNGYSVGEIILYSGNI